MDSNEIDVVDNGAIVKVFLLEGAFPWNAPAAILDNAGSFFSNYGACSSQCMYLCSRRGLLLLCLVLRAS